MPNSMYNLSLCDYMYTLIYVPIGKYNCMFSLDFILVTSEKKHYGGKLFIDEIGYRKLSKECL